MADWKYVDSIELDMKAVFYHEIKIYDKQKMLLDSTKVKPEDGMKVLIELNKKWEEWRRENGVISTSG